MKNLRGQARVEFLKQIMWPMPCTLYIDADTRKVWAVMEPTLVKAVVTMDRINGLV